MTTPDDFNDDAAQPVPQRPTMRAAEVLLILSVFFIIAGDPPPHVNEAHYLARLKHYWNPAWCPGDLFLESQDAQFVLVWMLGWVTCWLSLPATAWLGRLLAWTLLAVAWQRLSWRLVTRPLAAVLAAALFVTLIDRAHMAGEWVVGGVEGKAFAYGFVLLALADVVNARWSRTWLLLGAATAFHPLVGGWSIVVCGGMWLLSTFEKGGRSVFANPFTSTAWSSFKNGPIPFFELAVGALLALVGIVPALMLTSNEPPGIIAEASRIYVFERLPHHLALLRLPADEVTQRLLRHGGLLVGLALLAVATTTRAANRDAEVSAARARRIALFAWGAAWLAIIGLVIELMLWNHPLVAARLQRYYWYRLSDFAAPMAVALLLTRAVAIGLERRRAWSPWLLTAALVFAGWHLADKARQRMLNPVPPADAKMRDLPAWIEACEWIAANTPEDALFLTPRLNLTFKWRAGRAEVVNRKDIPQDARSIIEWHQRLREIYYTEIEGVERSLDSIGLFGAERVRELALKYGASYALMDRTQLVSLPHVYLNKEYVVYRIENGRTGDGE
jgi:hypothetical protein